MSDDTRDLTQRIRDALRGDEDEGNLPARISHWLSLPTLDAETDLAFTADMLGEAEYDLLALYRLLRAALARIEADAATIAALRAEVVTLRARDATAEDTIGKLIARSRKVDPLSELLGEVDCATGNHSWLFGPNYIYCSICGARPKAPPLK